MAFLWALLLLTHQVRASEPGVSTYAEVVIERIEAPPKKAKGKKPPVPPERRIEWSKEDSIPSARKNGEEVEVLAILNGQFKAKDTSLMYKKDYLKLESDGRFTMELVMPQPEQELELVAIDPLGKVSREKFKIRLTAWSELKAGNTLKPRRFFVSPGIGFTSLSYRETNISDYSAIVATGKLSLSYVITPDRWDAGVTAFATLLPLSTSRDAKARFLGVSLRAGYRLPGIRKPWQVTLMAGAYYTTMFVSGEKFGFHDLAGPQIFPTFRRELSGGKAISGYFKFSPVTDGVRLSFLSLKSREIALGAAYLFPISAKRNLALTLDLSNLQVAVDDITAIVNTASLGVGTSF